MKFVAESKMRSARVTRILLPPMPRMKRTRRSTRRFAPRSSWSWPAPANRSSAMAANRRSAKSCDWPRRLGPICRKPPSIAWPLRFSPRNPALREPKPERRFTTEVAKRLRIDPMVKKAMEEAFAVVLDEFRTVTLKDSAVLESVRRQVHGVTGGQMREFAQRLRDAAPRPLTEEQILAWADKHYERTAQWPRSQTGLVIDAPVETWGNLNIALSKGLRSLPGGSSLAKLLAGHRSVRNMSDLSPLTIEEILAWADEHFERTGKWPKSESSGTVTAAPGETWKGVQMALVKGRRGLQGGSSLARLFAKHRGVRNHHGLARLSIEQILVWADLHRDLTGKWPNESSGVISNAKGETWGAR